MVFLASLLVTVVLLLLSLWTGHARRRKAHLWAVSITVVSLAGAIYLAEWYGSRFTFEDQIRRIHLFIAKASTLTLLGPIVTGLLSLRRPNPHPWHGRTVALFVFAVVVTVVTGTMMTLTGVPR
jgi:hypothetical protein